MDMSGMNNMNNMSNMNNMNDMSSMMGSGMGNGSMMGMMMYFHTGFKEFILFEELETKTKGAFAAACVVVFLLGIVYELLKFLREELAGRNNERMAHVMLHGSNEEKQQAMSARRRMLSWSHVVQTLLHLVQVFLSYCLMLIFMTYNVYLCVSVILGATLGYFLSGWKRSQVTDQNEHCH